MTESYVLAMVREGNLLVLYSMNGRGQGDELARVKLRDASPQTVADVVAGLQPYLATGKSKGEPRRETRGRKPASDPTVDEEHIIGYIREHPGASVQELAAQFKRHPSWMRGRFLVPLVESGRLRREKGGSGGVTSPTYYYVNERK